MLLLILQASVVPTLERRADHHAEGHRHDIAVHHVWLVNQFNAEPGLATHQVAGHQKWIVVRAQSRVTLKPLTLAQFKESAAPRDD